VEITKVQQWVATALAFTMGMISSTCMAGYSVWSDTLAENGNAPGLWAMGAVVGVEAGWPPQAARLPAHRIAPSALFTIFLQWGFDAGCKSPLWGARMTFVLLNHSSL